MKRAKNAGRKFGCVLLLILIILVLIVSVVEFQNRATGNPMDSASPVQSNTLDGNALVAEFANEHHLQVSDWPENLIELLEKNPETKEFVLYYPIKKDLKPTIDLKEYKNTSSVPLLMQWDQRWGYSTYAGELMGLSGCGPTCLSMVSIYLLHNTDYTPRYVADFAEKNGYSVPGNGSDWKLISKGGEQLGLDITEIPLDENRIVNNLKVGNPIICVMGPGDFTTTGHFIVMTEYVNGKIRINDPNSKLRSEELWDYDRIQGQIRNLWVCRT